MSDASEELNQMDEAVVELLDVLDNCGTHSASRVIEHGTSWHMSIAEHERLEDAIGKIKALLGMQDK